MYVAAFIMYVLSSVVASVLKESTELQIKEAWRWFSDSETKITEKILGLF
jgi:hypothetical protein